MKSTYPIKITDWDATWPREKLFQTVAVELVRTCAGALVHIIDTSGVAAPGKWNQHQAGAPDIIACVKGRYVAIELKAHYGRMTPNQKAEAERTENAGGTYVAAKTLRQVFDALGLEIPE